MELCQRQGDIFTPSPHEANLRLVAQQVFSFLAYQSSMFSLSFSQPRESPPASKYSLHDEFYHV